ncbi:YihY/virulence factor BrkB family protein [Paenibacillus xerothermodurans]|uniref:YihY/virulence factor BrkB family protein n=1 Tax=Paenibacillus xerothermodurans TaxID=1977292 RepID=A0A2W1NWI6_PAEXE|nr:YihY/virulence factor BrkB family protein [Paenibacillus xerothermodurans]
MLPFLKELIKQLKKDDALGLSAQCAYYFLFSLFPFLMFLMSLLGYLPISAWDVLQLVKAYVPQGVPLGMEENLHYVLDAKRGGALSFGLFASLLTASAAMDAIILAVNKAYGLPARESFIHSRLLAVALTVGMLVVFFSALLLSVFSHTIGAWMHEALNIPMDRVHWWDAFSWLLNMIILFLVFLAIYFIAPNACLTCKDVLPGAVTATLGWHIASTGFSYYIEHWNYYNVLYGSLGGVMVLLTWFYVCAFLIILGGEINAIAYLLYKRKQTP